MADRISQTNDQDGPGASEKFPSGTSRMRLTIWIIAGILLALWAYSYWGMGPAGADVQVGYRLPEEEKDIQNLLAQQGKRPEVDVFQVKDGRRVEITLTNGAADSLASMDITSPPEVAKERATALARTLKTSYGEFDEIRQVEVGFAERLTVEGVGGGRSAHIILDEDALQALGN